MAFTKAMKDNLLPAVKPSKEDVRFANLPKFDMDADLTVLQAYQNLKEVLNLPNPGNRFFIWRGEKDNKRLELNIEHQYKVRSLIEGFGLTVKSLAQAKAWAFLTPQLVQNIIDGHDREVQLAVKEFQVKMHAMDKEMEAKELLLREKEAIINQINQRTENEKLRTQAEVAMKGALTDEIREKVRLMKKVVDNINLNELPDYLRAFVIQSIFNPSQPVDNDAGLRNELREVVKDAMRRTVNAEAQAAEAEADLKRHQSRQEGTKADTSEHDFKTFVRETDRYK